MEPFGSHDLTAEPLTAMSSARRAAAAVRTGETTSGELTAGMLARIASRNPQLNAVCELDSRSALAAADRVDAEVAHGGSAGPLAGVPMTVKEAFHATGLATTWGILASAANRPTGTRQL